MVILCRALLNHMIDSAFYVSFLVTAVSAIVLFFRTKKRINTSVISIRLGKRKYLSHLLICGVLSGFVIFPILDTALNYFALSSSHGHGESLIAAPVFNFLFALVIGLLGREILSWESAHEGHANAHPIYQTTDIVIDKKILEEKIIEAMRATKEFIKVLRANNLGGWAEEFMPIYSLLEKRNFIGAISLNKRYSYGGMGSLADIYVDNQSEFDKAHGRHSQALTNIRIYTEFGVNRASLYH